MEQIQQDAETGTISSRAFHTYLINRCLTEVPDLEIRDVALWMLDAVTGDNLLWWHISPADDDEVLFFQKGGDWKFEISIYEEDGFSKLRISYDIPNGNLDESVDLIDTDKSPFEYPPIAELSDRYDKFSVYVNSVNPQWKQAILNHWNIDDSIS